MILWSNKNISIVAICLTFSVSLGFNINPFLKTPLFNNYLSIYGSANVVKAAPDQSMVLVGFSNGSVVGYDMITGNQTTQFIGPSSQISQIIWVPNIGPMSLDNQGNVYLWYQNGTSYYPNSPPLNFEQEILGISVTTQLSGANFVAFSQEDSIVQYEIDEFGFSQSQNYAPPNDSYFTGPIMYSAEYNVLFAAISSQDSSSQTIYSYNCSQGSIANTFTLPNYTKVQVFAPFTNGSYIMLLQDGQIYSFTNNLSPTFLGSTNPEQIMATCLSGPYIVTTSPYPNYITIWSNFMTQLQSLSYPTDEVISMDCNGNYLVTLDDSNYLAVVTYFTGTEIYAIGTLAGWIIGVIIAVAILFFTAIVICIVCCCCRRRNRGAQLALNNSMGQELMAVSPNYQFHQHHNPNYNGQFSYPSADVRFQTNAYANNVGYPQPIIY